MEEGSGRKENRILAETMNKAIDCKRENLKRISLESLEKLGNFFIAHGLLIEAGDLLMNAD